LEGLEALSRGEEDEGKESSQNTGLVNWKVKEGILGPKTRLGLALRFLGTKGFQTP